jgi:hypothetical protein
MSFLDGKPRVATESDCKARWLGGKPGEYFRCAFCGHKFVVGDTWHGIFTNDIPGAHGNPLVCDKCYDGNNQNTAAKWLQLHTQWKELRKKHWWFIRQEGNIAINEFLQSEKE